MVEKILTIIKSAPYGREDAFAGLRFSLSQIAAGMLETCDTLLIEDGVYNAKRKQDTFAIRMPSNLDATEDILDLDGRVFVVKEDMESRYLTPEDLLEGVEFISIAEMPEMMETYDAFATY
jgi:sulfur relay (sulfurtransferase) DsrF/TusC family protein